MRITCPSCSAEYDLPAALPAGRVVRCVRCGSQWAPVPLPPVLDLPMPVEPTLPEAPPAPRSMLALPAEARPPVRPAPSRAPLALAWVSSALLLAALLAASYVFRDPIMHAWPPSTRVYTALGLA